MGGAIPPVVTSRPYTKAPGETLTPPRLSTVALGPSETEMEMGWGEEGVSNALK